MMNRTRALHPILAVLLAAGLLVVGAGSSGAVSASVGSSGDPRITSPSTTPSTTQTPAMPQRTYDTSRLPQRLQAMAAGEQWYELGTDMGMTMNCVFQYLEPLGRSWVGYYGELGKTPTTSQPVYYTKIGWGVSGSPCGGGAYTHIEEFLPPGSQLAISQDNPVICWHQGPSASQLSRFGEAQGCPQAPQNGVQGGMSFDPNDGSGAWPTATGAIFEIWVPIRSTQPLNGLDGNPCKSCLQAGVWMIDGNSSPWGYPKIPVYVGGGTQTSTPSVSYPAPSVRDTACCSSGPDNNQAAGTVVAWIFTTGKPGTTEFQFDNEPGAPYDLFVQQGQITQNDLNTYGPDIEQSLPLYFAPDTQYYWRLCFTPNDGSGRKCGAEQTFEVQSPPDNAPPDTAIDKKPAADSGSRAATFEFSSSKQYSTFRCKLDGGEWQGCVSPQSYGDLADGQHTFSVKAVSQTEVEDGTPATYTWTVNPPPDTTITSGPPTKTRKRSATFEFTASEVGATFRCKLDDAAWKACSSPASYAKLSRGKHVFSVRATDTLGKVDPTPAKKAWTIRR